MRVFLLLGLFFLFVFCFKGRGFRVREGDDRGDGGRGGGRAAASAKFSSGALGFFLLGFPISDAETRLNPHSPLESASPCIADALQLADWRAEASRSSLGARGSVVSIQSVEEEEKETFWPHATETLRPSPQACHLPHSTPYHLAGRVVKHVRPERGQAGCQRGPRARGPHAAGAPRDEGSFCRRLGGAVDEPRLGQLDVASRRRWLRRHCWIRDAAKKRAVVALMGCLERRGRGVEERETGGSVSKTNSEE